jgi:imidazolonepropionase
LRNQPSGARSGEPSLYPIKLRRVLADFLVHHTSEVLTCAGPAPRVGSRQADAAPRPRAAVAARDGIVVFVGDEDDWRSLGRLTPDATVVDARGGSVVPGFVDPHTHVVFAGDRRDELRRRLAGATYAEIAAAGGGIVSTVRATRAASCEELAADTRRRLDEMLRCGTTTAEAKSGYGLTLESELKMLRAIRALDQSHAIELSATFMGAHEVPLEYRGRPDAFVELLIGEMIPAVARERLAEWCDVFCETGVFSPDQSRRILRAARASGLKLRVHADELGPSGGSRVAAETGARSADHLVFVERDGADALAAAGVVATLLPIAAFYLKLGRFAPARMLVERGVAVALATDVNPGGGFSPSMPFAMALACFGMGLTFEESLVGATINAAYALDRHDRVGSLEVGKQMDAVVVAGPAVDLIRVGAEPIAAVVKRGRVVSGPRSTEPA